MILKFKYLALIMGFLISPYCFSQGKVDSIFLKEIEREVIELMDRGDIPGLSLVIINNDQQIIRTFGYSNLKYSKPITSKTLFELGSCTKAFTALAITQLERQGKINLDRDVRDYLPWFYTTYKDSIVNITLRQLLYHTSGIPWNTLSKIPATNDNDALEQTVRQVVGQELDKLPGKEFQYATINYDILALVAEGVTGQSFETYIQNNITDELGLTSTSLGKPKKSILMSTGYKIGFFSAREYQAPVYKGNNAAGYLVSNADDIAVWLKFQMGLQDHKLYGLAVETHQRDKSVALHEMSSYAMGWQVALDGTGEIYHAGKNPNFTSYIVFRAEKKIGVAVLANSNSNYTMVIGNKLMKMLANEKIEREFDPGDGGDKLFSGLSLAIFVYIFVILGYCLLIVKDIVKKRRTYQRLTVVKTSQFGLALILIVPFLFGIYILPQAIANFSWKSILVWLPTSFQVLFTLLSGAIIVSYMVYLVCLIFPAKNELKQKGPLILLLTIITGLSNVLLIMLVTSAIDSDIEVRYLLFYYILTIGVYLLGRKYVQINLIKITRGFVYDLRIKLVNKIFSTSYDKFEVIDRGKVYTALNDDVNTIGDSTNLFILLITSIITVIGAFLYLASLAFWATLLTTLLIVAISVLYYFVGKRTSIFFEQARDSRNVFMSLLNGMIDGYKEISLHRGKKIEYQNDVRDSADQYRIKMSTADIRFTNAFLVGESLLVILLGIVSIGLSEMFPNIRYSTITSFIIILLYLIGPFNSLLHGVPEILNLRIAWDRVQKFILEIPANVNFHKIDECVDSTVYKIEARAIKFKYEEDGFCVGPIDLVVHRGEILFITGGNGSGKTTLAKMLTGLYPTDEGHVLINEKVRDHFQLSEYFSVVFNPPYLFEKLYDVDLNGKQKEVNKYLELLDLKEKVEINGGKYSTLSLSGGQKKRLALFQCYLENYPIYLFDEWAADQDPEYRKFFYRTLLPQMKSSGKIVIAITHDDHYFDVADQIIKLDRGQVDFIKDREVTPSKLSI